MALSTQCSHHLWSSKKKKINKKDPPRIPEAAPDVRVSLALIVFIFPQRPPPPSTHGIVLLLSACNTVSFQFMFTVVEILLAVADDPRHRIPWDAL